MASEYFVSWCLVCEKRVQNDSFYCSYQCQFSDFLIDDHDHSHSHEQHSTSTGPGPEDASWSSLAILPEEHVLDISHSSRLGSLSIYPSPTTSSTSFFPSRHGQQSSPSAYVTLPPRSPSPSASSTLSRSSSQHTAQLGLDVTSTTPETHHYTTCVAFDTHSSHFVPFIQRRRSKPTKTTSFP